MANERFATAITCIDGSVQRLPLEFGLFHNSTPGSRATRQPWAQLCNRSTVELPIVGLVQKPENMQRIVSKALQKKRAGRYQTAKEILFDIRLLKQEWDYRARFASRQADDLSN